MRDESQVYPSSPQSLPQDISDPTVALTLATQNLVDRVAALTQVVADNNKAVVTLRSEVNRKPDDTELAALGNILRYERKYGNLRLVAGLMIVTLVTGGVTYFFANHESQRRCEENKDRTGTLIEILRVFKSDDTRIDGAIQRLQKDQVKC